MGIHDGWRRAGACAFAGLLALALLGAAPLVGAGSSAQAQSRVSVTVDFRAALGPYGRWEEHPRWGEVWLPRVERGWRPYTVGRWVHTEQWGWYWISADAEADWGWIAFHYGRWVFDRDRGWMWVPGTEWSPGWVQWRRGTQQVGWAPLPPDEIVVEYRDEPDVWVFVRPPDVVAPLIFEVLLPPEEIYIRQTVVVNRTVVIEERGPGIGVNPGIAPAIIAAAVGRPLRAYDVRPRILAGTAQLRGAQVVSAPELRRPRRGAWGQVRLRETSDVVRPAARISEPQPLAANEQGRLGDNPPRAARAARGPERSRPQTSGSAGSQAGGPDAQETVRPDADAGRRPRAGDRGAGERRAGEEAGNEQRDAGGGRSRDRREASEERRQDRRGASEDRRQDRRESVGRPMQRPALAPDRGRTERRGTDARRPSASAPPQLRSRPGREAREPRREGRRGGPPPRGPQAAGPRPSPRASAPPRPRISAPARPSAPPPAARAPARSGPPTTTGQGPSPQPRAAAPGPRGGGGGPPGKGGPGGGGGGPPGKGGGKKN